MSGRMRITKFIEYYRMFRKKFPTLAQLEREKKREEQVRKDLLESDFHDIEWDKESKEK